MEVFIQIGVVLAFALLLYYKWIKKWD